MSKKNVFFTIACLFLIKCIVRPIGFADSVIAISIIFYNLINKVVEIKKIEKLNEVQAEEINKVKEEITNLRNNVESIKTKDQFVQSLGGFKK
jgi:predicted membrane protein